MCKLAMRHTRWVLLFSAIILTISSQAFPQAAADSSIVGDWQGTLTPMGARLRVVFHVMKGDSNTLKGTIDSPDQGAFGIPMSAVTVKDDSVFLGIAAIGGNYEGKFSDDKMSIDGKWKQGGAAFDLSVNRGAEKIALNRPQEPKPPFPYKSEDVAYENSGAGIKLAGTLTLPDSGGPFPAVILITGSGPENRDEELFGHKPFLVIADHLTRNGIAVLRVDDRSVGGSTGGTWSSYTTADYATDVVAGIKFLKTRADINPKEIGLIGHSEGGIIAPMVAAESEDVAYIVMLAGTGYSGDRVIVEQTELIEKADGAPEEKIESDISQLKREISIVEAGKDSLEIARKLEAYLESTYSVWGADLKKAGSDSTKVIDAMIRSMDSRWFKYFLTYDPAPTLEKVKCPVLAMDGTLDLQVPAEENLKMIGDALKKGGNKDYTIKLMPGLNHMFQDAKTGSTKEYSQIEETFSPAALKLMANWILENTDKTK